MFLVACGAKAPPPHPARFSARAEITVDEKRVAARVTQERPGALEVEFTAPEELVGFALSLQGDKAVLRYEGMESEMPLEALPGAGFAPLLSRVLLRLAQPGEEGFTRAKGGGWVLKASAGDVSYEARISPEGLLTGVSAPGAGLEVELSQD